MNNLKNLYPCLDSIRKYTTVSYETLVVTYLFSKENLEKAKHDFPWVTFIESNEIRGFSENNNLALRQAKGKYCFVVNDDTEMKMPVIDMLVKDFGKLANNVACLSPKTLYGDGRLQICGRPPKSWKTYLLSIMLLKRESDYKKWINKPGLFKSYTIHGAAFLIKRDVFEKIGWFDEYYFFCPEDIKVGMVLNEVGYECWVDSDVSIYHYEGGSSRAGLNLTQLATEPAATRGCIHFYGHDKFFRLIIIKSISILMVCITMIYNWLLGQLNPKPNRYQIKVKSLVNTLKYSYGNRSPKEIFSTIYFNQVKVLKNK